MPLLLLASRNSRSSSHTPLLTATTVYDDMEDRASSSPLRLELLRKPLFMSEFLIFSFRECDRVSTPSVFSYT